MKTIKDTLDQITAALEQKNSALPTNLLDELIELCEKWSGDTDDIDGAADLLSLKANALDSSQQKEVSQYIKKLRAIYYEKDLAENGPSNEDLGQCPHGTSIHDICDECIDD